jgi:hypothetical protein
LPAIDIQLSVTFISGETVQRGCLWCKLSTVEMRDTPRWGRRAWRDLPRERVRGLALPLAGAAVDGLVLLPRDFSLHSCTGSRGRWYQVTLRPWPTPRGSGNRKESPEPGARERVCFAQNRARACPKTDRRRDENGHVAESHPPPSIDIIGQSSAAASQPISRPTIELGLELGELPRPEHQEH